jgi:hypothetical protein
MNMTQISRKKHELEDRVTAPGYLATARDVAEAAELVNQYMDELERLEKTATVKERTIHIIRRGGKLIAEEQV